MVTGVDIYHETLTVEKFSDEARNNKTHDTDLERDTLGWYIRDEIAIGDTFVVSGGARIEEAEIKGKSVTLAGPTVDFDETKKHDGKVFEISATWLPRESMKFYSKFSTVYRYPFVDEQATFYGYGSDTFLTDIDAEKGKSIEAGFTAKPGRDLNVGLSLFQIDMEDEISWNELTFRNENLDDTRHLGLEINLDYELKKILHLNVNYTYQKATFKAGANSGNEVPLVPNHLLNAELDLQLPYNIHFIPSLLYVDKSYLSQDFDNNAERLDSYTVVDLLLSYKKQIGNAKWTFFLGVHNLFDEEYSTFGVDYEQWFMDNVYYPSPGRKFFGGISATF